MKRIEKQITLASAKNIVNWFASHDFEIETVEGTLLDAHFINTGGANVKIGRLKARKYLAVVPEFVNEWTSKLMLVMIDNLNEFETMRSAWL